jgi:microcystin-dependent protein
MTFSNINALDLLGKQVSYSFSLVGTIYETDGQVTSVVLNLHGDHEFSVDDGDFFSFDEITDFKIL